MAILVLCLFSQAFSGDLPRAVGYVNDFAGIIDSRSASQLDGICTSIEKSTGVEIAIVTIDSLGMQSVEEAASAYYNGWGIGKKGQDNGVVILVAAQDHKVRIEPGYGLEGQLPDGLAGEIIRYDILPRFKQGDYGGGLLAAVYKVGKIVGGETVTYPKESRRKSNIGNLIYLIFIGIVVISSIFGGRRGGKRGSTGGLGALWFLTGMGMGRSMGGGFSSGRSSGGFGGFGGFGGGMSGGGGASGSW